MTREQWKYERETKTIRTVPGNHWIASIDSWDSAVDNEVNAAFIIRACNSHDDLLAALENIKLNLRDCKDTYFRAHAAPIINAAIAKYKGASK